MRFEKSGALPSLELAAGEQAVAPPRADWLSTPWAMYVSGLALQVALYFFFSHQLEGNIFELSTPLGLLVAVVLFLPLHEALHGVMHPGAGLSKDTVVGLESKQKLPFCIYTKPTTRSRVVWTALMPFLVLTLVPAVGALAGACPPGLAVFAVLNAAGCGLDLCFALYAGCWLPPGARVGYDHGNLQLILTRQ